MSDQAVGVCRPVVVGLGEVLWDRLPGGKSLGGAPANFAFHANQLGARGVVASCVGRDALGREIAQRLGELGLTTNYLRYHAELPTGTVDVTMDAGKPSYEIHAPVAWDALPLDDAWTELAARADAVCFGTLAQRHEDSRRTVQTLVGATRRDCWRIFDINLRQSYYDAATITASLRLADVLKLNDDELPRLAQMLKLDGDESAQAGQLIERFSLRLIALTRGDAGSVLFTKHRLSHHPGHQAKVVDTVGAGDSFTAALTTGLLGFADLDRVHDRASRVAAYVCGQHGATPTLPAELLAPIAG